MLMLSGGVQWRGWSQALELRKGALCESLPFFLLKKVRSQYWFLLRAPCSVWILRIGRNTKAVSSTRLSIMCYSAALCRGWAAFKGKT